MDENLNGDKIIFSVTEDDLQQEAVRLVGKRLNEDELYVAAKGIDWSLSFDIETVFRTAINEAVKNNDKRYQFTKRYV